MPFIVISTVRATKEQLPGILADVQKHGLDALRDQPGFLRGRLLAGEDETAAAVLVEWQSREAFVAYRQTEMGRRVVGDLAHHRPQITFYEVVAAYDK